MGRRLRVGQRIHRVTPRPWGDGWAGSPTGGGSVSHHAPGLRGSAAVVPWAPSDGLDLFPHLFQRPAVQRPLPPHHQHGAGGGHAHHGAHEAPEDPRLQHGRAAAERPGSPRASTAPQGAELWGSRPPLHPPRPHTHLLYSSRLEAAQLIFSTKPVGPHSGMLFCGGGEEGGGVMGGGIVGHREGTQRGLEGGGQRDGGAGRAWREPGRAESNGTGGSGTELRGRGWSLGLGAPPALTTSKPEQRPHSRATTNSSRLQHGVAGLAAGSGTASAGAANRRDPPSPRTPPGPRPAHPSGAPRSPPSPPSPSRACGENARPCTGTGLAPGSGPHGRPQPDPRPRPAAHRSPAPSSAHSAPSRAHSAQQRGPAPRRDHIAPRCHRAGLRAQRDAAIAVGAGAFRERGAELPVNARLVAKGRGLRLSLNMAAAALPKMAPRPLPPVRGTPQRI